MTTISTSTNQKRVAYWLLIGVFMIFIQIILGGVTRLTGSGLSITEWNPIMGAIPPLNQHDWQLAFEKYQGIAQYKKLNTSFTLDDFKSIYFWEWFHRVWARSLGVVFAIPFIYFLIKKYFTKNMVWPLVALFILGGIQGLVGWIMVQSGLNDEDIYVSHIRLSIHFLAALVLLIYTFWFALKLLVPKTEVIYSKNHHTFLLFNLIILSVQLLYGGFMAGLKAAIYAPTWPMIHGQFIPDTLTAKSLTDEPLNVHFIHRTLAYILFILIVWGYFSMRKLAVTNGQQLLKKSTLLPPIFVITQVVLGILTVLQSLKAPIGKFGTFGTLAELHQIVAILLLLSLVYQYYLTNKN
jgi:cytochrome c oxidase assembly protein subunit 15